MSFIIDPFRFGVVISPADFPNLIRWYKADSFSLSDGDDIGGTGREWVDQSPAAPNDATQATLGNRPLYKTNIFGSMPAIKFFDQFLIMNGMVLSGDFTVIAIAKSGADSILFGITSVNNWIRFHVASTDLDFEDGGVRQTSDDFTTAFNVINMSSWRRGGGTFTFRERNIARGDAAKAVISKTFDQIGGTLGVGVTDMHLGEVCVWTSRLSDTDVDNLYTNYFKSRYSTLA